MLREILEGYARADAFFREERRTALPRLTPEQAWATFRALWRVVAQAERKQPERQSLDILKVEGLIQLRRKLDRLATRRA
jgi:hypothetical protein